MSKTTAELHEMYQYLKSLYDRLPVNSGHRATVDWYMSDVSNLTAAKIPEMREIKDWYYNIDQPLFSFIDATEKYLKLVLDLTSSQYIFLVDAIDSDLKIVALKAVLKIPPDMFHSVSTRMYQDRILLPIDNNPGYFRVNQDWQKLPKLSNNWVICKKCIKQTYVNEMMRCDFCHEYIFTSAK